MSRPPLFAGLTSAIALVGTALSIGAGVWLHELHVDEARQEFRRLTDRIESEVRRRFVSPLYGLNGLRGLHAASDTVTRSEFRQWMMARDMGLEFPGVRGFGRIEAVTPEAREAWLQAARADGAPDFTIRQLNADAPSPQYVIRYIEPVERNAPAVGLDVGSEPRRRAALERAVDTAAPALSAPISLVQDGRRTPGFLLFAPLYTTGEPPADADARRKHLRAVLYAPIVARELLSTVADTVAEQADFELFAVTASGREEQIFDHDEHLARATSEGPSAAAAGSANASGYAKRLFMHERRFDLHGLPFVLRTSSPAQFDAAIDRTSPWLIGIIGLLATAALSWMAASGARARRRAEALAESMTADLDRLAAVARHTFNAVVITDLDRRITWVNEAFERVTGYSAEEAIGRSPGALLQCERTDLAEVARLREALDAAQPFRGELVNRSKDGHDYWIELEIQPIRDSAGVVTGFMAVESDITERKTTAQQLQAARVEANRLAMVARGTSNAVVITDREARIEWVNEAFTRLYGYTLDQAVGRRPGELLGGRRTSAEALATLRQALDLGTGCRVEVINVTADGRDVWVDTEVQPRRDAEGRVDGFVEIQSDITARREADERMAALMRENAGLLGTIRQHAIVSIADASGTIVDANEAFCAISGFTREELVGRNHRVVNSGVQPAAFWTAMWRTISSGQTWRGQICNRAKDGSLYWVDSIIAPFFDAHGRIEKYVSIRHDITASKRAAQQLAAQRQRLESIVAGTGAGTWEHHFDTGEDLINDLYASMLGYTLDECRALIATDWSALVHPDDLADVTSRRNQHLHGLTREYLAEFRMRHRDGRWIWIQTRGVVSRRNERGEPLTIAGIHLDITERKHAERELARSRERLAQIIDGTHVGTWEWNVETGETVFNERWAQICGYTLAELGRTTIDTWSNLAHPEDLSRSSSLLERHFNGELPNYECEARMRHKDGHWVWVLDRGKLFSRSADGRPRWMAGTHMDITERKAAEAALRDGQALLDRTGRIGGIGGWSLELDTMTLRATRQLNVLHDLPPDHPLTVAEGLAHYVEEDQQQLRAAVQRCIERGEPFDLELRLITATGRQIWVRALGEAERAGGQADGDIVRIVGALQDITARRRAEAEAKRSGDLLRNAIEAIDEAFVLFDGDDRLVMCNDRYRQIYAHSADLIVPGARFEDIIRAGAERGQYAEAVGRIDAWVSERMATHLAGNTTRIQRLNDGRTLRIVERRLDDGHIVGFRVDVTELERAREQAESARRSASEALARLQAIYDILPVGITITDPDGHIIDCNPASEQLLGISKAEHLERRYDSRDWQILREDGTPMPPEEYASVRALTRHEAVHDAVMQVVTPKRRVWLSVSAMPADHPGLGVVVGYVDVTEQRAQQAALLEAKSAAEQASVAKSQFLANMSHEIRTPMNAILGMLALLRRTELSARQADYAAKTEGAARSLLGLLNDILDFSKVEAGKMTLDPHPFRFDQLMRDLGVILSASVGSKPIEVLFDLDPQLPRHLHGDALRLQQVLINLAGNAVKFTAQGEVVISVQRLSGDGQAVQLRFAVRDTGIGIAKENQAKIFDGFNQAEASTTRRFGGTGLGLAISQRLVSMMGGRLELDSELGRGTCFSFVIALPCAADPGDEPHRPHRGALRVLAVDDNATARTVLQRQCESLGWSVELAGGGDEALDRLAAAQRQRQPYDAILMDWDMPGRDGFATLDEMTRRGLRGQSTAVLMVTAHGREQLDARGESDRALLDAYLVKPLTASMLLDAVVDVRAEQGQPPLTRPAGHHAGRRLDGLRLLLVEDNPNNQQVACELLGDEGATLQVAHNGAEAVAAVAADPTFDLVLMDLQMPVMDGYTAAARIRQDLGITTLPIVAMTANAMASDRDACLAAGMNDHVGKPFDIDQLVGVIQRWCGRSGQASAGPAPAATAPGLPAAVRAQAEQAGVALDAALRRLGGKAAVLRGLLQDFMRDAPSLLDDAESARAASRPGDARRALHTAKGLAATLGMTALAERAAAAEAAAADPGASGTAAMSAVVAEFARLQAVMPSLLQAWTDERPATEGAGAAWPVDHDGLRSELQALAQLLADSDMGALDALEALLSRHPGATGDRRQALESAVRGLDFDAAHAAAQVWIGELAT